MKTRSILCLLLMFLINETKAQVKADDIIGVWLTAGKDPAKIQIYKSGQKYYGKIAWLKNPTENGKPKVDSKNPDKSKQT